MLFSVVFLLVFLSSKRDGLLSTNKQREISFASFLLPSFVPFFVFPRVPVVRITFFFSPSRAPILFSSLFFFLFFPTQPFFSLILFSYRSALHFSSFLFLLFLLFPTLSLSTKHHHHQQQQDIQQDRQRHGPERRIRLPLQDRPHR